MVIVMSQPAGTAKNDGASTSRSEAGLDRTAENRHKSRSRALSILTVVFLLAGIGSGLYWFFVWRFEESTDNAYVAGNQVRISSQVTGDVAAIFFDNNNAVRTGQVLLRLDATDAELALQRARSSLADAVRQIRSLMAESDRLASQVELRRKELEKARGDYERRKKNRAGMAVSEEEMTHARDNLDIAALALEMAEHDRLRNFMLVQDTPLEEHPVVKRAAQSLREAWLTLQRCAIKSPVDGYVVKRSVQLGAHVTPGMPLMAVVPLNEIWVDANFKEVQLGAMRTGQPARVHADMYGKKILYEGMVQGFSAGTGSSFSLLPPENATGNWIKVVQRVPVKIVLKAGDVARNPLLLGLSCHVVVDIRDTGGTMLAETLRQSDQPVLATDALEHDLAIINREINEIIQANAALGG